MDTQVKKQALKEKPYKPKIFIRGDELMVRRYKDLASTLYTKMSMNDMIENYLIDHPACETHPELKDMLTDAQDILGNVYFKRKDITH